jgi:predicted ArsR family transcriptional regulator
MHVHKVLMKYNIAPVVQECADGQTEAVTNCIFLKCAKKHLKVFCEADIENAGQHS